MQNLPKIARERLRAGSSVANHPDADLLSAFAEKSLPAMERDSVLEHLARCGDCRDIIALSLPEVEAATVVVPVRGGWLAWPALRWGVAAAGVVLIASLGIVQFKQRSQTAALVARSRPDLAAYTDAASEKKRATVALTAPTASAANQLKQEPVRQQADTSQLIAHSPAPTPPAPQPSPTSQFYGAGAGAGASLAAGAGASLAAGTGAGIGSGASGQQFGPRAPSKWQQQQQTARLQAKPAPSSITNQQADMASNLNAPSPSSSVEASGAAPQISTETTAEVQSPSLDFRAMSKAKAPVAAETPTGFPQKAEGGKEPQELPVARNEAGRNVTQLDRSFVGTMFRWTIGPNGVLRRSFDQGETWQDIDVTASQVAVPAAMGAAAKRDLAAYQSADAKPSAAVVFRVVTANGRDVWAGGSNGALYHSTDTGNHWIHILPQSDGVALSGDIVSIQFSDLQHGGVLTSTGETWTTSDSGQTWRKQ